MVFENHVLASHPESLTQERLGIRGVMQHIHEHHDIHHRIGVWNIGTIENLDGDACVGARGHIDAMNSNVRTSFHDETVDESVAAADVEHLRVARQKIRENFAQDPDSTLEHELAVQASQ